MTSTAITIAPILIVLLDLQTAWRLERQAAEALTLKSEKLNEAIQRQVSLHEQLQQALSREIGLNQRKSKMIETISHEFRTPLTIINQSSDLLTKYANWLSEEKKELHREAIESQVLYLNQLLQDVLIVNDDQERTKTTGYFHYSINDLADRLQRKWEQEQAERTFVFVVPEEDRFLWLDAQAYYQVVDHLIDNAVKFSDQREPIRVELRTEEACFLTTVQDRGIGIPEGEQAQIFDLFHRGNNVDYRRGMGLGLYIAQKIAHALNGRLSVFSLGAGTGSTFNFCLPLDVQQVREPNSAKNSLLT